MFTLLFFSNGCSSQDEQNSKSIDRQPFAAGKFFTDDPKQLQAELDMLFNKAVGKKFDNINAVIAPHAGYAYSGEVAASGINQIDKESKFDNIFVIASSHRVAHKGASIYYKGDYISPLGKVKVNRQLAEKLVNDHSIFNFYNDAHAQEHSLEIQLPLLQYHLENEFRIVPILMTTQNTEDCRKVAEALKPYFNKNNLFVISTDFSHYPPYEDAAKVDEQTANAIISNSVSKLQTALAENKNKNIPDLATSLCGWSSVITLLHLTEDNNHYKYHKVQYMNSGDQPFGDKNSVVGYYSIVITDQHKKKENNEFELTNKDKKDLLHIARITLDTYIKKKKRPKIDTGGFSDELFTKCGVFVTLHIDGQLRGCIGRFTPNEPLYEVVREMAIASSTQDSRFPPVGKSELNDIDIEISVLTPLKKIESIDEIEMGKHGIYIKKGYASGTFLPQVAEQTSWTLEEFLGHCARDKARIGWDGWKDAEVYTYEAIVFDEKEMGE